LDAEALAAVSAELRTTPQNVAYQEMDRLALVGRDSVEPISDSLAAASA
jgi:hypothetical protein